jgi:DNA-binding response OmpR family regulator
VHILVIEDNPDIVANLYGYLEPLGYVLDSARSGTAGLAQAAANDYDAIILDVMLPGIHGLELCHKLRTELGQQTPVIMLTAKDTIEDRVEGLNSGADDYLVKPFSLVELEARLKALIRRSQGAFAGQRLSLGPLSLVADSHEVVRSGIQLKLTPTGFTLLKKLLAESPRVLGTGILEREVWGDDVPSSDALRTHIHSLRQVLDKPFDKPMLKTVSGFGYQLVDPDEQN